MTCVGSRRTRILGETKPPRNALLEALLSAKEGSMARKAVYRRTSPAPVEDVLQGADLTQFLESYEELCASVRMAGRWILGRARNKRDQRLLTRFRQTLRMAEELLDRTQPSREPEAFAFH